MIMCWNECNKSIFMIIRHWFGYWLGATRQQAITWTNVDLDLCHHMAPLSHNVLNGEDYFEINTNQRSCKSEWTSWTTIKVTDLKRDWLCEAETRSRVNTLVMHIVPDLVWGSLSFGTGSFYLYILWDELWIAVNESQDSIMSNATTKTKQKNYHRNIRGYSGLGLNLHLNPQTTSLHFSRSNFILWYWSL